ncbi:MAG: Asp23/Gls24 family envelope stress response protein [Mogibacterium sp.]|nr:Asp23/Gls24 family envelope stress response protein [Mogibacterium sp.]
MAVIERNEYGAVGVNKSVIEKMIIEDLLELSDSLILCNKKGKPIKEKPTPWIDPDQYDAIEVTDKRGEVDVKIYIIARHGSNISKLSDKIFDSIGQTFELLRLDKPSSINVKVRGIMSNELVKRNIEVVRKNG